MLPALTPRSTVTAMGAAALVPLVISLTLLSKKALDLAGKEEEKSEKVNMMNYLLLISEIISLFSFSCLKDYQMKNLFSLWIQRTV